MNSCDHRGYTLIHDHSTGDQICSGCGIILESFAFDDRPAWNDPPSEPVDLLGEFEERDSKKLKKVRDILRQVGHDMKLTEGIMDLGFRLVIDAFRAGLKLRDSTSYSTAASALYYACKIEHVDRAEVEMAINCHVSSKQLTVSNKHFRRALAHSTYAPALNAPANPVRLIPRFLDVLSMAPDEVIPAYEKPHVRRLSEDVGHYAIEKGILEGKSPECCCITFIYMALQKLGYPSTVIDQVCQRCGLTPNTIGNAIVILEQAL